MPAEQFFVSMENIFMEIEKYLFFCLRYCIITTYAAYCKGCDTFILCKTKE